MFIVAICNDKVRFKVDEEMREIFWQDDNQAEGVLAATKLIYLHIAHSKNSALQCRLSFKTPSLIPLGIFSDSKLMIEYKESSSGTTSKKLPFFVTSYNVSIDRVHDTPGVSAQSYIVTMVAQNYIFHLLSTKVINTLVSSRDVSSMSDIESVDAQFSKDIKDFVVPSEIAEKCFGTVEVSDEMFKNMYMDMRFRPNPIIIRNTYYSYMLNLLRFYKTSARSTQYRFAKEFPQIYYNFYLNSEDKFCINICKSTPGSTSISDALEKAEIKDVITNVSSGAITRTYSVDFKNEAFDAIIDAFDVLVHKSEFDESIKINYPLLVGKEDEGDFIYGASPLNEDDTFGVRSQKKKRSSLTRSVLNLKDKNKDDVDCPVTMYGLSVLPDTNNSNAGGKIKLALGVDRVFMENAEEIGFDFSMR